MGGVFKHIVFSSLTLAAGLSLRSTFRNLFDIILPPVSTKADKLRKSIIEFVVLSLLAAGFFYLFGKHNSLGPLHLVKSSSPSSSSSSAAAAASSASFSSYNTPLSVSEADS